MPVIDNTNGLAAQSAGGAGSLMVGTVGAGGPTTTAAPAAPAPGTPAPSSSGANVPNLMGYLNANQGNDTSMGQAVGGVVNKSGQESNQANTAYQANAAQQVKAGTPSVDPNIISEIDKATPTARTDITWENRPDTVGYTGPIAQNVSYGGPSSAATVGAKSASTDGTSMPPAQPNLLQAPSTEGDGSYGMASQAHQTLGGQVAQSQAGMPGISSLLEGAYNNTSMGENNLNAALVNAGAGGQQQTKNIYSQYKDTPDKFNAMVGGVNQQITGAKKATDDVNATYSTKIKGAQEKGKAVDAQNQAAYQAAVKAHSDQVAAEQKAKADADAAAQAERDAAAKRAADEAARPKPPPPPAPPAPPPMDPIPAGQLAITPTTNVPNGAVPRSAVYGTNRDVFMPGQIALNFAAGGEVPYAGAMQNIPSILKYVGGKKEDEK